MALEREAASRLRSRNSFRASLFFLRGPLVGVESVLPLLFFFCFFEFLVLLLLLLLFLILFLSVDKGWAEDEDEDGAGEEGASGGDEQAAGSGCFLEVHCRLKQARLGGAWTAGGAGGVTGGGWLEIQACWW